MRRSTSGRVTQIIMSENSKTFVEKYLTNKGKHLIVSAKTRAEKDKIWLKYGKNRYKKNLESKPVCKIIHTTVVPG